MIKKLFDSKNFSLDFSSKLPVVNGSTTLAKSSDIKTLISLMIGKMIKIPHWHCVCSVLNLVDNLPNREHMIRLLQVVYFYFKNGFVLDDTRYTVHITSSGFYIADSLIVLYKVRDNKGLIISGFTSNPSVVVREYSNNVVMFYPICC